MSDNCTLTKEVSKREDGEERVDSTVKEGRFQGEQANIISLGKGMSG